MFQKSGKPKYLGNAPEFLENGETDIKTVRRGPLLVMNRGGNIETLNWKIGFVTHCWDGSFKAIIFIRVILSYDNC